MVRCPPPPFFFVLYECIRMGKGGRPLCKRRLPPDAERTVWMSCMWKSLCFFGYVTLFLFYLFAGFWAGMVTLAPIPMDIIGGAFVDEWVVSWFAVGGLSIVASLVAVVRVAKSGEYMQTTLRLFFFFVLMLTAGYCLNLARF